MNNPLADDLDHILKHTKNLWEELRGQRLFITGGTGFFGCWLLESFVWANDRLGLNATAVVLTRNADIFRKKAPHLANHPAIKFHHGDVRSFDFPEGDFRYVIHAAVESSSLPPQQADPLELFDVIVNGTRRVLEFAVRSKARKFLYVSSGAVYGKQPEGVAHVSELSAGAPDPTHPHFVYGEGKRAAEMLCAIYCNRYGIEAKIARGFSFVGPYLPLDSSSVIMNFIRDGLKGGPILVKGDGTPYRSHLYAADLAIWLWTILFKGQSRRAYNVGSDRGITILELAKLVAEIIRKPVEVRIAKQAIPGHPPEYYVPSLKRVSAELGLKQTIKLSDAISRTILWNSHRSADEIA